jgi:TonB family protein
MNPIKTTISVLTIAAAMVMAAGVGWSAEGDAPRVEPSWRNAVVRHLQQYKRYPTDARSRGEGGVVQLSFTVDRSGHVLNCEVQGTSGHPELDSEAISIIEGAQPLPPFPASMPQAKLNLTVPIRFFAARRTAAPPPLSSGVPRETPKEECDLLRDRKEAWLCAIYPLRESILNSLVDRDVPSIVGVRYKVPQSCPVIPTGETRPLVCGMLVERYELYCCK